MPSGEHHWSSPFPELQVGGKPGLTGLAQIKSIRTAPALPAHVATPYCCCSVAHQTPARCLCYQDRAGLWWIAFQAFLRARRPGRGRQFAQTHSSQISKNYFFFFPQILPNTQLLSYTIFLFEIDFNGIALDLARGKEVLFVKGISA